MLTFFGKSYSDKLTTISTDFVTTYLTPTKFRLVVPTQLATRKLSRTHLFNTRKTSEKSILAIRGMSKVMVEGADDDERFYEISRKLYPRRASTMRKREGLSIFRRWKMRR
eukprot:TRINITY_DN10686_c0_g3_i2.p2 TRINITY_DN10686_c0_g3~~TRINITY_DN10686_c0_g3_i2.p2  ORF type:complete len:111 (+),score=2.44 TRINITY_DN10686_c0_g3_i2:800-1132(+)